MLKKNIHAVVGVLKNYKDEIFLARRQANKYEGGLWEFPGGKIKTNEEPIAALCRELREEIGIRITNARPLIKLQHEYPEYHVYLDVWLVNAWEGEAHSREGQRVCWVKLDKLDEYAFPNANSGIIKSLKLPEFYLISPPPSDNVEQYLSAVKEFVKRGTRLIQLRYDEKTIVEKPYIINEVASICHACDAKILLNSSAATAVTFNVDGVHLNSSRLLQLNERPLDNNYLVSASCHNQMELSHAERVKVDFAVLSPINETDSHPDAAPLGWEKFAKLVSDCNIPVFALGGMLPFHMQKAWQEGAQGIAMLSGIWGASKPGELISKCLVN